ncbi:hypothetical protein VIBHAR_05489 [Vibrio campbellii ATCC BAA-1116]|uniref:Uncharacterized protein n=1 Tax=Vibrio campbellii (strain ATCC BAA-1116) TaxID=2902295 RepID=A7N740_VIBC1|nr:hypothetical protein VIBHAR_05489 [Vibrio campbellii ATCC BAA-1116]
MTKHVTFSSLLILSLKGFNPEARKYCVSFFVFIA